MNLFNAKFILNSCVATEENNKYTISAEIVDNSGMFFSSDAKINDIIYLNGSVLGQLLLRYKLTKITSASGSTLEGEMIWDMEGDPIEISGGLEGIIGEQTNEFGTSMITGIFVNSCDESVVSAARSYEQQLLANHLDKVKETIKNPTLGYTIVS